MKSDLVEVAMTLMHETEKAILVSSTGEKKDAIWLPKSQCQFDGTMVTMPEWLAKDKCLI